MQITACEDCDNVHTATRRQSYTQWQCVKFPKLEGLNPVAPREWIEPPYMRCVGINGGHCVLFAKRREGQKENGL
jgi:hypothetical protein